jgi:hypothetical protein
MNKDLVWRRNVTKARRVVRGTLSGAFSITLPTLKFAGLEETVQATIS